jgi:hypothetical protein
MTNNLSLNGNVYRRQVEMLGDVEKITWYESEKEVYDQDLMIELEEAYDKTRIAAMSPSILYI